MSEPTADQAAEPPLLRVVKGNPTDAELAAVLAVLQSRSGPSPAGSGQGRAVEASGWSAYWRSVRAPVPPGAGAWRGSGRS